MTSTRPTLMRVETAEESDAHQVTNIELFFDLVYVFHGRPAVALPTRPPHPNWSFSGRAAPGVGVAGLDLPDVADELGRVAAIVVTDRLRSVSAELEA
jgi:hypothetical protein